MDKLVIKPGERVSHAYIVASASEEARRETAQRLAAAMLCESGGERPCGECRHCRKVFAGIHPDVISVAPGVDDKGRKRREILVDQVRFISADAQVMPNEARVKVYVVHDADRMNAAAQNALLKLLEEPPASAAFVLCAANPALLLPTVRSRCVLIRRNADAAEDEQSAADALALLSALAAGDRVSLLRWEFGSEDMDPRRHDKRRQRGARGHTPRRGPGEHTRPALRGARRALRQMLRHAQAQRERETRLRPDSRRRGQEMRKIN